MTAVELMPVHHHARDRHLEEKGLTNYWGYNSFGYFAPERRLAASRTPAGAVREFKRMVRALHDAGLEVILDVVYNHTAEGNQMGPTLSLKGIDNVSYYRLVADNPRYYMDFTGCGNTLNMQCPQVLQLIMDSLRYWVLEMHVDGFRFDLASALARELFDVDRLGAFFDIIHQDPVLSQVKLIAEPWDLGQGGYQVGNFPVLWTEWNGKYRDSVRQFWKGEGTSVSELATRLSGSNDLYAHGGRQPYASINFVTAHDGFTLQRSRQLQREAQREERRGEPRRGEQQPELELRRRGPDRRSARSIELRERQKRNFLATMLLSQGVPMISHGDELGRTQLGNNNAYCQDNELTWIDWNLDADKQTLLDFVRKLRALQARAADASAAQVLPGAQHPRRPGRRLALARRPRDGRRGVAGRLRADAGHAAVGNRDRRGERARRADYRRYRAGAAERPHRQGRRSRFRHSRATCSGTAWSTRSIRRARTASTRPASATRCRGVRSPSSRSWRRCANGGASLTSSNRTGP